MKRFYQVAAASAGPDGFDVMLDGRPVRTPFGRPLAVADEALAQALAAEWQAQERTIVPATMPLTGLVNTAIDRIAAKRDEVIDGIVAFGRTDLLCYRAGEPEDLAARQAALWQPLLDWAEARWGARLVTTEGIVPVAQPEEALAALRAVAASYDDLGLAALGAAVAALGSLILGLALAEGRLSAAEAFAAAQLDETFQNERWGEDAEAVARREGLRREVEAAGRLFALHRA